MERFLEVQVLQVNLGSMYWETVVAKDSLWSDLVLVGDCEHFARGRVSTR